MQNDFVRPDGQLVVPAAEATVPHIKKLLKTARNLGLRVAFTQDTHYEGDPEWGIWPEHCREGTWGWEIIDELKPRSGELVCPKSRYDGFYGTWLDQYLSRVWQVEHLIIVGTVSNICVAHTAASAGLRWFHMVIPANGISAQTEFDQALTLRQVSSLYAGEVVKNVEDIQFER
jgi:nicotinamidase-related amidase